MNLEKNPFESQFLKFSQHSPSGFAASQFNLILGWLWNYNLQAHVDSPNKLIFHEFVSFNISQDPLGHSLVLAIGRGSSRNKFWQNSCLTFPECSVMDFSSSGQDQHQPQPQKKPSLSNIQCSIVCSSLSNSLSNSLSKSLSNSLSKSLNNILCSSLSNSLSAFLTLQAICSWCTFHPIFFLFHPLTQQIFERRVLNLRGESLI